MNILNLKIKKEKLDFKRFPKINFPVGTISFLLIYLEEAKSGRGNLITTVFRA